jgi:hypothetical protein
LILRTIPEVRGQARDHHHLSPAMGENTPMA